MSWHGTSWLRRRQPRVLSEAEVQAIQKPSTGMLLLMASLSGLSPDYSKRPDDAEVERFIEVYHP